MLLPSAHRNQLIRFLMWFCSAAGPHTVVNGKDVINMASADFLGLIGHPKITVRCLFCCKFQDSFKYTGINIIFARLLQK